MKSLTMYIELLFGVTIILFLSACKDPDTTHETLVCFEDEPCIVENSCNTILVPRKAFIGDTYDIDGEIYTVVCNVLIREMINNDEDISRVITSLVTDMSGLFEQNSQFNVDISKWDVSNVTNMESMFKGATSFNQDISCWHVNNVVDMSGMFDGASSFNQDLSEWNVNNAVKCSQFDYSANAWRLPKPNFTNCTP